MRLEATQQTRLAGADVIPSISARVAALDWATARHEQDEGGSAVIGSLLTQAECETLASGYDADACFRSRVVIARHGFGQGEYKYYAYPLPEPVATLRTALYPKLAEIANEWEAALGREARFPLDHSGYLARCHEAGQVRPTPLLLRYGPGDYNCLHQDLYGELHFPLQGGRPAQPSRRRFYRGRIRADRTAPPHAVADRGRAASPGRGGRVRSQPAPGSGRPGGLSRGHAAWRKPLRSGRRYTLGVIFHDAK